MKRSPERHECAYFLIIGLALVLLAFIDALWTTLWVDGNAGPVSSRIATGCWHGALALIGRHHHKALSLFGPFILMLVVVLWVAILWLGWTLVFGADEQSLLHAHNQTPANWIERFYFVGYMMFTAGNGDFAPNGNVWQIAGAMTNATGMLLVTLAITFLLSVVSAVVKKRAFASQVTGLGETAAEIVESGWNGQDLMAFGVPAENRPSPAVLRSTRASVRSFLDTLPSAFIHPAPNTPAAPDLSAWCATMAGTGRRANRERHHLLFRGLGSDCAHPRGRNPRLRRSAHPPAHQRKAHAGPDERFRSADYGRGTRLGY